MSNTVKPNTCPKCGAAIPAGAPQGLCPKCVMAGAATATESGLAPTATGEIPSLERVAAAFPQLEVLELIGRGGMGFVFKARQPSLDRLVALKLLPDKLAKDANFTERFNREGRVLGRLNHANIVSIYDFGQTGGFYYLLMEYVDGVNLRQAMRAGRFSPAESLAIVPKVCEALQYAHEQGVLHRDIKPENILLDTKGRVKIADFGIAKLVDDSPLEVTLTGTGAALGTPHYMAPEQLEKPSTVDHRADIYSLGVVFYEMLTGELPIGRFAAPSSKTPVGANVDEVVFRTLEKEPGDRYQSAGEVQTCVQVLADEASAAERRGPASAPMGPHGTVVVGDAASAKQPARGSFSRWSIYGALGVGLSLPVPLMMVVSILTGRGGVGPAELWAALGSVALPGLGGTLLGWLGLNEIRESRGRLRGLPLAMFATLMWPLTILGAVAVGVPMFLLVPGGEPTASHTVGRFLVLLLPAAVIAFSFWAIHATARWAGSQQVTQQRGLLKWVFIVVLLIGVGVVLVTIPERAALNVPANLAEAAVEAAPMIQFTFTSVELREEQGARWLAMDFVQQVRGDCEHTFRYDARVPGFTAQTRKDSRLSDAKAGFAPVLHQRVLWKLPDSLEQGAVIALRDLVAKEWVGRSAVIEPDDERVLFKSLVPGGGTLTAAVGVKLKSGGNAPSAVVAMGARTKVVEFSLFKNSQGSIFLTTTSPLGPDEALVPILERPDGRREMGQFITILSRENNRPRERVTAVWNWSQDRNYPPEETKRIESLLEENFAGRPLTLVAGQPLQLFSLTNRAGGVLRCHLDYQPDFAENAYRSTESDRAMVRVEQGIVSSGSSSTLIVWLKPSIPSGHSLQPTCDGTIGTSGSTERSISQSSGNATFTCNWRFPASFTSNDVFAAQTQCEKLGQSPPFAIPSGGRRLLFAVTNQAGEVHRGYLELVEPDSLGTGANTSPSGLKTSTNGNALSAARQVAASAELWAPNPATVEQPKPYEILQEANSLAKEGQYEQALQRHLWYHRHALEFEPSQRGVRLSFALMQWMELARRYPKAKDALVEIRDQCASEFPDGNASFTQFVEVSFINKSLGEDHATVALFKVVQERNPKLARQCYQLVADLLVETGEYALSASFLPDAQERFGQICAKREKMLEEARKPKSVPELLRKEAERLFIKETRTLIEILVGIGRKDEAEEIRDQAVALVDVTELQSAVADAEHRVAKHSVVPK